MFSPELKKIKISCVKLCARTICAIGTAVFYFPQALDAFFFVVAQDGKIVFASENVGRFLNCSREELMHRSVYSILHPSDHAEFLHNFMPQGYGEYSGFVMDAV